MLLGILLIGVYFKYNPEQHSFFPKCPFLQLTGLECPGCGSQRVLYDLLHGDVRSAFSHNALLVVSIPLIVLLLLGNAVLSVSPKLYNLLNKDRLIRGYLMIVIVWWVLRNLL